jgi:hypothetical protein
MTTRRSRLTLYLPFEESSNSHLQSHSISVVIVPSSHTHSMTQVRKEGRKEGRSGIVKSLEMLIVVCSADVNITQL